MYVCGLRVQRVHAPLFQVQWMEEKLSSPDGQSGDSEVRLFQRCQELQALAQEKEDAIARLEQQLEEQVERHQCSTFSLHP